DLTTQDLWIPMFPKPPVDFRLPESSLTPLIMIGAGTGLTPFLGFLSHRALRKDGELGEAWLFHGRRFLGSDGDAIYGDELKGYLENGALTQLHECLSREDGDAVRFKYVQNGVKECGKELWKLIVEGNASIFVCG